LARCASDLNLIIENLNHDAPSLDEREFSGLPYNPGFCRANAVSLSANPWRPISGAGNGYQENAGFGGPRVFERREKGRLRDPLVGNGAATFSPAARRAKKLGRHRLGENMDRTTAGLLKRHPLLRTRDSEEVGAHRCTFGYKLDVRSREALQRPGLRETRTVRWREVDSNLR